MLLLLLVCVSGTENSLDSDVTTVVGVIENSDSAFKINSRFTSKSQHSMRATLGGQSDWIGCGAPNPVGTNAMSCFHAGGDFPSALQLASQKL